MGGMGLQLGGKATWLGLTHIPRGPLGPQDWACLSVGEGMGVKRKIRAQSGGTGMTEEDKGGRARFTEYLQSSSTVYTTVDTAVNKAEKGLGAEESRPR